MARSTDYTKRENKYLGISIGPEELVQRKQGDKPAWEMVLEIMKRVPQADIDRLPSDGSEEHDHYIYGTRKNS